MRRCLELASKGLSLAMPNPSVGAVLVYKDEIIGEGFTSAYGGNHGEVNCINSVLDENKSLISKSILYVSLEPCSHTGKTPPCSNLIIENNIPEVVIGCVDTFSLVAGKGIEMLQNKGIKTTGNVLEEECRELNKRFFTFHEKKRPFVILKWAQTKDGFIAPTKDNHEENRWISGSLTNQLVHQLRKEEMGILVGTKTVLVDNPSLTTRKYPGGNPIRVIIDKDLSLWKEKEKYSVFNSDSSTLIINNKYSFEENNCKGIQIDFGHDFLNQLLNKLYTENIQSIIIEGGAITLQLFIDANLWDEAVIINGEVEFKEGVKAPNFKSIEECFINIEKDRVSYYKNKSE